MKPTRIIDLKKTVDDDIINIALDTIEIGKQALIFAGTKKAAEKIAEDIARKIKKKESDDCKRLSLEVLKVLSRPTKQCERLSKCLKKGVAFHHSGLHLSQRELVETSFREGKIKIICCTPTLAAGVDLPAFRVIVRDYKRYGGMWGMSNIPILEVQQMFGRAGRPKFDDYGEAILYAGKNGNKKELYNEYIIGESEPIYSKLAVEPVLRTYLLSLIAANFVSTEEDIKKFFSKTFYAFQYKDMKKLDKIIVRMLKLLESWNFVVSSGGAKNVDFITADEINHKMLKPTLLGLRVAQLYIDPMTAAYFVSCLKRGAQKVVDEFSLLQMISHTLEMRPLLKTKANEWDSIIERINSTDLIDLEPNIYEHEYEEFVDSVKTAMFFYDWIEEFDEESLFEKYNIRPGEIDVKISIADWLLYSCYELCRVLKLRSYLSLLAKLRMRLKYGAKEELLPLLKLKNIGKIRARKLFNNGIKDIGAIKKADMAVLAQLIGEKTSKDIKKQVGQNLDNVVIKEGKRKGQISLKDYY